MGASSAPQPTIKARTLDDLYKTVLSWDYDNLNLAKVCFHFSGNSNQMVIFNNTNL